MFQPAPQRWPQLTELAQVLTIPIDYLGQLVESGRWVESSADAPGAGRKPIRVHARQSAVPVLYVWLTKTTDRNADLCARAAHSAGIGEPKVKYPSPEVRSTSRSGRA
jgi:hypothetical protein